MEDTVIQKILSGELHNGTDNVSTVGLESLNSLGPGNTCLCHDQINVARFNSSLVNLFFFLVCLHSSRSGGGGVWLGNDRAHVWHPELLGSLCLELRAQIFYLGLPKNYEPASSLLFSGGFAVSTTCGRKKREEWCKDKLRSKSRV
nr:hypothetical protein Itr_chr11CG06290 [Ipomoea trifida]